MLLAESNVDVNAVEKGGERYDEETKKRRRRDEEESISFSLSEKPNASPN